jgi:hypothetical protein
MALATDRPGVDRIPPNNLSAEMAVLGSILVDREMMATVSELVKPADFYALVHEVIYSALIALYDRGEPLDKITVAEDLRRNGQLEKIGGVPYLTLLMDTVPTAASAEYYAKIVREKSTLRGLIHAGTRVTQLGFEGEEDVDGALDQSEQIVYEVGRRQSRGDFASVEKLLKGTFEPRQPHRVDLGLPRYRRIHGRFPSRQFRDLGRAPGDGQDVDGAEHGSLDGPRGTEADRRLLARNDERGTRDAPALRRGTDRCPTSAPRKYQRSRVGQDL